jgi:hypothetical protein
VFHGIRKTFAVFIYCYKRPEDKPFRNNFVLFLLSTESTNVGEKPTLGHIKISYNMIGKID